MLSVNFQWLLSLLALDSYRDVPQVALNTPGQYHALSSADIHTAIESSKSCCEALGMVFSKSIVAFPNDSAYQSSTSSYFSLKNSDLHPACIVFPESAQQVSTAVQTLTRGFSKWDDRCKFAIRGGGHTTFTGASSLDEGTILDLRHMTARGLSPDHKSVVVSPGQTWAEVTEQLDPYNLSVLGARVAGVGVGGAVLGCGMSYFSARYGFICDMAENFEVVLANGDIVEANANYNQDLWKALRGGGNNFGVVTSITLKTFAQGPFWGGQTFHDISTRKQHFTAHADLVSAYPYDPHVHYINTLLLSNATRSWFIGSSLQYTQSDPVPMPHPAAFQPFLDIPQTSLFPGGPSNTIRIDNVTSVTREFAALATYPKRWLFATTSFAPSAEMMEEAFHLADDAFNVDRLLNLAGFSVSLAHHSVPSVMSERRGAVDSLGPIQTQGNIVFLQLAISTDNEEKENDHAIEDIAKRFLAAVDEKAKSLGVYRTFLQGTYAEKWQNPLNRRAAGTMKELLATAMKYDPEMVFQIQVSGGFKLPKL